MTAIKGNREISLKEIEQGGIFQMKISLSASPVKITDEADVVFLCDRSRSMKSFVPSSFKNILSSFLRAGDYDGDGKTDFIRTSLISFDSLPCTDVKLTEQIKKLEFAASVLSGANHTDISEAFSKAFSLLKDSKKRKIAIIYTDGCYTEGRDPLEITGKMRAEGIEIYVIYPYMLCRIEDDRFIKWTGSRKNIFSADCGFNNIYSAVFEERLCPAATGINVSELLSPCFELLTPFCVTRGSVKITGKNSFVWSLYCLGTKENHKESLTVRVKHCGKGCGCKKISERTEYTDNEKNIADFPLPFIYVRCRNQVIAEDCPEGRSFDIKPCQDFVSVDAGSISLSAQGTVVAVNAVIENVCPCKSLSACVALYEKERDGSIICRGMKFFEIPPHYSACPENRELKCIKFILPGESLCKPRRLFAEITAHYNEAACKELSCSCRADSCNSIC